MKRFQYLLIIFCFLLMGQPLFAEAKEVTYTVSSSKTTASAITQQISDAAANPNTALTKAGQQASEAIYQCLADYDTYVDISKFRIPYSDKMATTLFDTALEQDLYLFNTLANTGDLSDDFCSCYTTNGYFTAFEFDYGIYNAATLRNQYSKLKTKALSIIKELKLGQLSKERAVLAVHDYIALHTAYDESKHPKRTSYTAYGALVKESAVCSGYSTACELLLSAKKIPSIVVSSDSMDHAWNIIKLGKHWYHMDITWDDPYPGKSNYVSYRFFLRTDKEIKNNKKNPHYDWDSAGIKCTSKTYSKIPTGSNSSLFHEGKYWYRAVKTKSNTYTYYRYNFKCTSKKKLVTSYVQPKLHQSRIYYAPKKNQIYSMNITGKVQRKIKKLPYFSKLTSLSLKNSKLNYNYKYLNRKKSGSFKLTAAMKKTTASSKASKIANHLKTKVSAVLAPATTASISAVTSDTAASISTVTGGATASISSKGTKLTETQINALYRALKSYKTCVDLKKYKVKVSDLQTLLDKAFTKDYYVQDSISWLSVKPLSFTGRYIEKIQISYKYQKTTMKKRYAELKQAVKQAKKNIGADLTDFEAAVAVHDYIIKHAAFHKKYADKMERTKNASPNYTYHSAYGILCKKTGVCSGYAYAYRLLLAEYGIESIFIESSAMNHGWNMVKLNNQWYHVDVTWDDPDANANWTKRNSGDLVHYEFFLLNNAEISAAEHYNWNPFKQSNGVTYSNMPRHSSDIQTFHNGNWYMYVNNNHGFDYVAYNAKGEPSLVAHSVTPFVSLKERIIYQPDNTSILSMNEDGTQIRSLNELTAMSDIPSESQLIVTGTDKKSNTIHIQYTTNAVDANNQTVTKTVNRAVTLSDYDLRTTDYATSLTLSKTKATLNRKKNFTLRASIGPAWPLLNDKVTFHTTKKGSKIIKIYNIKPFSCKIKGLKKGTATVYVKVPNTGLNARCQINVK